MCPHWALAGRDSARVTARGRRGYGFVIPKPNQFWRSWLSHPLVSAPNGFSFILILLSAVRMNTDNLRLVNFSAYWQVHIL